MTFRRKAIIVPLWDGIHLTAKKLQSAVKTRKSKPALFDNTPLQYYDQRGCSTSEANSTETLILNLHGWTISSGNIFQIFGQSKQALWNPLEPMTFALTFMIFSILSTSSPSMSMIFSPWASMNSSASSVFFRACISWGTVRTTYVLFHTSSVIWWDRSSQNACILFPCWMTDFHH